MMGSMAQRALVLGGGGLTGIAWEWGILAGLAASGVDLSNADLVVGTSAGSMVGAQLSAGLDVEERYRAQLAPPDGEVGAAFPIGLVLRYGWALVGSRTPQRVRARIGRLARRARTEPESERVGVIESALPVREWPGRLLMITAVDAETGEFRIFDRSAGVPLVKAVAASCAVPGVWPPVTIDGRHYMDGGARSAANADLAAGFDRVVVLAPLPRGLGPITGVDAQVDALRARSRVALVTPSQAALRAFGRNVLDPSKRASAARAGWVQATSVVDHVRSVWSG
jgi:NTE family protein